MEDIAKRIRDVFKDIPGVIVKDEEREFATNDDGYVVKIIEK